MTYKDQHPKFPTKIHISTFTEKDYPYILYIYTIKCKEPIHFKPRSGKTIHFPITNYLNLHFELKDNTKVYPSNPYTYFSQKYNNIFHFLDIDSQRQKHRLLLNSNSKFYISFSYTTTRSFWIYRDPYFSNNTPSL